MEQDQLRHLQECELLVAREVKRICEKYQIRYFMVAGTLLGAVRHKGFIPWDDDMDFGMERPEYEKFCEACAKELPADGKFFWQTWDTDEKCPYAFGKLRLNGTHIQSKSDISSLGVTNDGIWVDVFPLDDLPDNACKCGIVKFGNWFFRHSLMVKEGYEKYLLREGPAQKIRYIGLRILCIFMSRRFIINSLKSIRRFAARSKSQRVYFESAFMKKAWLKRLMDFDFESERFPGIVDYDEGLTLLYGDYMTPPKPEDRAGHEVSLIDFGSY